MGVLGCTLPPLGGPKHGLFVKTTISRDIRGRRNFLLTDLFRSNSDTWQGAPWSTKCHIVARQKYL